jgi:hypothetical protein
MISSRRAVPGGSKPRATSIASKSLRPAWPPILASLTSASKRSNYRWGARLNLPDRGSVGMGSMDFKSIQKDYPEPLSIKLEKENPDITRSDEYFGERMIHILKKFAW